MSSAKPFKIEVPEDQLQWITDRVRTASLPPSKDLPDEELWRSWGLPPTCAEKLHKYWISRYDWRRVEAQINSELAQYTIPIHHNDEDIIIHFVHNRSDRDDAIPLLFHHGWPGSFLEVRRIIKLLTNPESPEDQAYHVVALSLPGFAFSSYPKNPCSPMDMADISFKLMQALGYDRFMTQGGDWGSIISRLLAARHPESCRAVHLNAVISGPPSPIRHPLAIGRLLLAYLSGGRNLTAFEKKGLERMKWWMDDESAYQHIHGTKPLTLSYALSDSPFGLACWVREKVHYLVDDDFEWDEELAITSAMPYIINGTSGHMELYKWIPRHGQNEFGTALSTPISPDVAVGASIFPQDVLYVPRWWAECNIAQNITFWKEHDVGGHFPAIERPAVLVADVRKFTGTVSAEVLQSMRECGKGRGSGRS